MNELDTPQTRMLVAEIVGFMNQEARYKVAKDSLISQLKEYFRKNPGLEQIVLSSDQGDLKFTYVAPTTRKVVDTNALKEQGLYDEFTKDTRVSDSVRITWN